MSLPRFFLKEQVIESEPERVFELALDDDDLKHAKALRLTSGEHIEVIDGDANFYELNIESFGTNGMAASIAARKERHAHMPKLALFQGLPKLDKLDAVIRGATEVGISEIHPVLCERSISRPDAKRSRAKHDRWKSIAKSAAMQSGRDLIPEVQEIEDVRSASKRRFDASLIFWEEATESDSPSIEEAIRETLMTSHDIHSAQEDSSIAIWIGPEGGITEGEVELMRSSAERSFVLSLGPTILRTETAGIVAPALVVYEIRRILSERR